MRLRRLSANNPGFKTIHFKDGFKPHNCQPDRNILAGREPKWHGKDDHPVVNSVPYEWKPPRAAAQRRF